MAVLKATRKGKHPGKVQKPRKPPAARDTAAAWKDGARLFPQLVGHTDDEAGVFAVEQAIVCASQSFYRFTGAALSACMEGLKLTGEEAVLFQLLVAAPRPRSASDLARYTNRDDLSNIQYSLRKMIKFGMIDRTEGLSNRDVAYMIGSSGAAIAERFLELRKRLIVQSVLQMADAPERNAKVVQALALTTGILDHGSRLLAQGA